MTTPPASCPYCGATLSHNMRFCGSCGQPVPGMNAGQGSDVYSPPVESTQVQPANTQPYQPDDPFFNPPPPQRGAPIPGQGQPVYSQQPQYQAPYAAEPPRKRGGLSLPLIIGLVVACVLCACIAGGAALALGAVPNAVRSVIPPEMPLIIGDLQTQVPQLQTELPNLQTQMPNLATELPNLATNVPGLDVTLQVPTELANIQKTAEALLGTPQPPAANQTKVEYEGITFSHDPALASKISGTTVPAPTGPDQAPWEIIAPVRQFKFEGYPLQGTFHEPQIMVYNVDEALKGNDEVATTIDQLKQLLQGQPTTPGHLQGLPFLPYWNAGQMMHTQVRYLKGPDGAVRGVRYLTQYGQDISKINNHAMFYTYQGFAGDGKYYVIAILPVNNPILPANSENMTTDEADQFVKNYEAYMNDIIAQLDAQPNASFNPDLSKLDAMMQSVEVK